MAVPQYLLDDIITANTPDGVQPNREHFFSLLQHYKNLKLDTDEEHTALQDLVVAITNYQPQTSEEKILKEMLVAILTKHGLPKK